MFDDYSNVDSGQLTRYRRPGFITDPVMIEHECPWDSSYPENALRYKCVLKRITDLKLLGEMVQLQPRFASEEELRLMHSQEIIDTIKMTSGVTDLNQLEQLSSRYDAIFINKMTWSASLAAAGCTIELVDEICSGSIPSGFALVRPPGHHAMETEANGYCFFNNVALAAKHAIRKHDMTKVLIVDWDVHHGQGTQQLFYNDSRVLYISIHRYEHGTFWPNLRESNVDYVGGNKAKGKNINIPLNKTGMGNAEYAAIFHQIIMPVAYEFRPELVLVSAGYDAALGCPEGEMTLTPAFYAHMLWWMKSFAGGKLAVVLEGGYCLESLSEAAALTARALIGHPCPLVDALEAPHPEVVHTIMNVMQAHHRFWPCFVQARAVRKMSANASTEPGCELQAMPVHVPSLRFIETPPKPDRFETRDCYPVQDPGYRSHLLALLESLKLNTNLSFPQKKLCFSYDPAMTLYVANPKSHTAPAEDPVRIKSVYDRLKSFHLLKEGTMLPTRAATVEELMLVHTKEHIDEMQRLSAATGKDLEAANVKYESVTFCQHAFNSARLSCGNLLQVVERVCTGEFQSGVAIIRPPGHHAEEDCASGFCFFNNVAVAAKYAMQKYGCQRILIVDWDVHHGNGTQEIFKQNPNVLYISVHVYKNGNFFPNSTEGCAENVGTGEGLGRNVNIPWEQCGKTDGDYLSAFTNIILPIGYEFNPDLVIVSCGFDAGVNDPVGHCKVTPEAFGHFTHFLSPLANGRIILALEGGYNKTTTAAGMTVCVKSLLGHPLIPLSPDATKEPQTIKKVMAIQSKYWQSLRFSYLVKPGPFQLNVEPNDYEMITDLSDISISPEKMSTQESKTSALPQPGACSKAAEESAEEDEESDDEYIPVIKNSRKYVSLVRSLASGTKADQEQLNLMNRIFSAGGEDDLAFIHKVDRLTKEFGNSVGKDSPAYLEIIKILKDLAVTRPLSESKFGNVRLNLTHLIFKAGGEHDLDPIDLMIAESDRIEAMNL